ncbi:MAG: FG-GAP-like repeat-containing protein [Planctomycetota bacterium]
MMQARTHSPLGSAKPFCVLVFVVVTLSLACGGCRHDVNVAKVEKERPGRQQGLAAPEIREMGVTRGWAFADRLATEALTANANDGSLLLVAAEAKFQLGTAEDAAEMLVDAAQVFAFKRTDVNKQAVVGLLGVGRLFEAIAFMENAIAVTPDDLELRRWLFDCLVNAEQPDQARPHGIELVRKRRFDGTVLFSLSQTEQRDRELTSLEVLMQRNSKDKRLEIGRARAAFDQGEFTESEAKLEAMFAGWPDFLPAWLLLGELYVAAGRFDELAVWVDRIPQDESRANWRYWAILGDWAASRGQHRASARAYWESAKRNPNVGKVMAKLAMSLRQVEAERSHGFSDAIEAIRHRAEQLEALVQAKDVLYRYAFESNHATARVAKILSELGLLWEAEAWAAHAIRSPDGDLDEVVAVRQAILVDLKGDTPWQVPDRLAINQLDLSDWKPPSLQADASARTPVEANVESMAPLVLGDAFAAAGFADGNVAAPKLRNGAIPLYGQLGFGGASLDMDLDGWTDVFLGECGKEPLKRCANQGELYRNLGSRFVGTAPHTRVSGNGFMQGVVEGDLNADGFADLVILNFGLDQVWINNGDGTFQEQGHWLDEQEADWSTSGAIVDLNADGLSDFISLKYCEPIGPVETRCKLPSGRVDVCGPTRFSAAVDQFYVGSPTGGLRNQTQAWQALPTNPGRGMGVVVGQLDDQAGLDVFITNDMTSNHYWSFQAGTDSDDRVTESATIRGLALDHRSRPQASMGIATGDFNRDGSLDFYVSNFEREHNAMYLQAGHSVWRDSTQMLGIVDTSYTRLGFGSIAADLDNDSRLEILTTNGHVHTDSESGYQQQPEVLRCNGASVGPQLPIEGDGSYLSQKHVGRSLWTIDFNRDHKLDLIVTHQGESTALLQNRCDPRNENAWLTIRLAGRSVAREAFGTRVRVRVGSRAQTGWLLAGSGYLSSNERAIHFGLGRRETGDSVQVEVFWPDGTLQAFVTQPSRDLLVVEGEEEAFELR